MQIRTIQVLKISTGIGKASLMLAESKTIKEWKFESKDFLYSYNQFFRRVVFNLIWQAVFEQPWANRHCEELLDRKR